MSPAAYSGSLRRRSGRVLLALATGGAILAAVAVSRSGIAGSAGPTPKSSAVEAPESSPELFGLTRMHELRVTMSAEEWNALQGTYVSRGRGGGFGGGPAAADFVRASDGRLIHRGSGFGGYFPWVHADLELDGRPLKDVGLRYKGNSSYTASENQLRRNMKIKSDLFGGKDSFLGVKTLNFNAGATDPSRLREALSFDVFRAAGVPAPRTAYAKAWLTVPGLYQSAFVGLYTIVENVNKPFLKHALPPGDGLLFKPEGTSGGISYLGDNWSDYAAVYRPEREATPDEQQRLIAFARLVNRSSVAEFSQKIESYLDVDEFLRFVAVNALLVNLDSFLGGRHNYYLYLDPSDNRFRFIPWDMDLSLASFGGGRRGGSGDLLDLSVMSPYTGQNELIARLTGNEPFASQYRKILQELTSTVFTRQALMDQIDAIQAVTADPLAQDEAASRSRGELYPNNRRGGFGGFPGRGPDPKDFVDQRTRSVEQQMAGTSTGYLPQGGWGGGRF